MTFVFCPLVTDIILKFNPLLSITLSRVSKALMYSVRHSFNCNDITQEQWIQLSRVPGLADYVLSLSEYELKTDITHMKMPYHHCPRLYDIIINQSISRSEKSSVSLHADDLDIIPDRFIPYMTGSPDCSWSEFMLVNDKVSLKEAINGGYHSGGIASYIFMKSGLAYPDKNIIFSSKLPEMISSGYKLIGDEIKCPQAIPARDARAFMRNVLALRINISREQTVSQCVGVIPLIRSCDNPYIPLYLEYIRYILTHRQHGDIVGYCKRRFDRWFWACSFPDEEIRREIATEDTKDIIDYKTIVNLRYARRLHGVSRTKQMRLVEVVRTKALTMRFYGYTVDQAITDINQDIIDGIQHRIQEETMKDMVSCMKHPHPVGRSVGDIIDHILGMNVSVITRVIRECYSNC